MLGANLGPRRLHTVPGRTQAVDCSELVALGSSSARTGNWQERLAAACDRLVHPAVTCVSTRTHHRRLIGLLLCAPFLLAGLTSQILYGLVDNGTLLALNCVIFAMAWIATAVVAAMAKTAIVEGILLVAATIIIGSAVSATGLLKSPLVLLLLVPPFECWWLHRSRGPSNKGWWASIGACAVALTAMSAGYGGAQQFSEQMWVAPLVYAVTMWVRFTSPDTAIELPSSSGSDIYEEAAKIAGVVLFRVKPDGEIDHVSTQSGSTIGVPPALLMGKGLFERIHVTDRVEYMAHLASARAEGERLSADLRVRMPGNGDGAVEFRSLRFEFVGDEQKAGVVLVLVWDCPEFNELKAAIAEARDEADSMDIAKGRFLASVSHELRTPLNAIIGFADMLTNEMFGSFSDPRQKEYAELIGQSGNHLLSVVNAILDVSKIESGNYLIEPEPFTFTDAVDMCHKMMILQARAKDIAITRDISKSVDEICADRRAVQQMLINLVSNAIKFTPNGGRIHISADVKDGRLHFRVNDNGIGISADDLKRIGQPFMQVQNSYTRQFEGTGLGLSLVKGLVTLHEGDMMIDSAPGCGTTVSISLPVDGPKDQRENEDADASRGTTQMDARDLMDGAQRKQA